MDKVSNVRLRLATIMLDIRYAILDEDTENLQKFEVVVKALLTDYMPDVKQKMLQTQQQILAINFQSPEYLATIKEQEYEKQMQENKLALKEKCSEERKQKATDDFDYLSVYDQKVKRLNKVQLGQPKINSRVLMKPTNNSQPSSAKLPPNLAKKISSDLKKPQQEEKKKQPSSKLTTSTNSKYSKKK